MVRCSLPPQLNAQLHFARLPALFAHFTNPLNND
jgi:hypothetical protein